MDELLHHCLRELSFDGDLGTSSKFILNGAMNEERGVRFQSNPCFLFANQTNGPRSAGCNVSRLNDFVAGFYAHSGRGMPQNSDPMFCSFIWSLVVQHPTVVVGLVPAGVTSEVWVAPQTSAKRKAKASGQEHVETQPAQLEPIANAKTTPLGELVDVYGDRLRIAVEPQAIFAAVTGSHIRVRTAIRSVVKGLTQFIVFSYEPNGVLRATNYHSRKRRRCDRGSAWAEVKV
jgi:transcription factor C subunit 3